MWIPGLDSSLAGVPDRRIPAASSPVSDVPADRLPVAPALPPTVPEPEKPAPGRDPGSPDRTASPEEIEQLEERLNALLEAAGLGTRVRLLRSREIGEVTLRRPRSRLHGRHRHHHRFRPRAMRREETAADDDRSVTEETGQPAPPLGPPIALGLDRLG